MSNNPSLGGLLPSCYSLHLAKIFPTTSTRFSLPGGSLHDDFSGKNEDALGVDELDDDVVADLQPEPEPEALGDGDAAR